MFRCSEVYRWLLYRLPRYCRNWVSKPVVMYFMRVTLLVPRLIPVRNGKGVRGPLSSILSLVLE